MSNASVNKSVWTKPEMQAFGRIGDVAGKQLTSTNQVVNTCGGNGGGTCKS